MFDGNCATDDNIEFALRGLRGYPRSVVSSIVGPERPEWLKLKAAVQRRFRELDECAGEDGYPSISSKARGQVLRIAEYGLCYAAKLGPAVFPRKDGGAEVVYQNDLTGRRLEVRIDPEGRTYTPIQVAEGMYEPRTEREAHPNTIKKVLEWVSEHS